MCSHKREENDSNWTLKRFFLHNWLTNHSQVHCCGQHCLPRTWCERLTQLNEVGTLEWFRRSVVRSVLDFQNGEDIIVLSVYLVKHSGQRLQKAHVLRGITKCLHFYIQMVVIRPTPHRFEERSIFVSCPDERSNWSPIYPMRRKLGSNAGYFDFWEMAESRTRRLIRTVQSNRGCEYLSTGMREHFRSRGTDRQLTTVHSQHENGVVKCVNFASLDLLRSVLRHKNLTKCVWSDAL